MVQMVEIVLIDDSDGSEADETVHFALDGSSYEIDLSDGNALVLRAVLEPFTTKARKVGGRTPKRRRPRR